MDDEYSITLNAIKEYKKAILEKNWTNLKKTTELINEITIIDENLEKYMAKLNNNK